MVEGNNGLQEKKSIKYLSSVVYIIDLITWQGRWTMLSQIPKWFNSAQLNSALI